MAPSRIPLPLKEKIMDVVLNHSKDLRRRHDYQPHNCPHSQLRHKLQMSWGVTNLINIGVAYEICLAEHDRKCPYHRRPLPVQLTNAERSTCINNVISLLAEGAYYQEVETLRNLVRELGFETPEIQIAASRRTESDTSPSKLVRKGTVLMQMVLYEEDNHEPTFIYAHAKATGGSMVEFRFKQDAIYDILDIANKSGRSPTHDLWMEAAHSFEPVRPCHTYHIPRFCIIVCRKCGISCPDSSVFIEHSRSQVEQSALLPHERLPPLARGSSDKRAMVPYQGKGTSSLRVDASIPGPSDRRQIWSGKVPIDKLGSSMARGVKRKQSYDDIPEATMKRNHAESSATKTKRLYTEVRDDGFEDIFGDY